MSELNEVQILEARIELLQARVSDLTKENNHYLELLKEKDRMINKMKGYDNCQYSSNDEDHSFCDVTDCNHCNHWKLREN